jgi:undecaprenyl-diphosphatase
MAAWILRVTLRDEALLHFLVLRRRGWLDVLFRTLTHLGGAGVTVGAALLLLLVGPGESGAHAAFALAASHLAAQAVKRSVSRPRPRLPAGIDSLVRAPDRFSFPSGHAAAALSLALPLATVLPAPVGLAVLALALVVGISRAYLGVHYPGDVLAGWILAAAGAAAAGPALALLSGLR